MIREYAERDSLPAVIRTLLPIPAQRKIRAIYMDEKCNAIFRFLVRWTCDDLGGDSPAAPSDQFIQTLVVAPKMGRAGADRLEFAQNPRDLLLLRNRKNGTCRIPFIKHKTAVGTVQTSQPENIPMLFEKPKDLRFFPVPAFAQRCQS